MLHSPDSAGMSHFQVKTEGRDSLLENDQTLVHPERSRLAINLNTALQHIIPQS